MLFKHTLGYGKFFSADNDSGGGASSAEGGDDGGNGETSDTSTDGEGDTGDSDGDQGDDTDVDALKASITTLQDTLKKERNLKRAAERDVKRLQDELKTAQADNTGDEWRGKYEELHARYTDAVAERAVMDAARAANAVSPKAVYRSLRDKVEVDDAGAVTNLDTLIDELKTDDPDLFRAAGGSLDGGAGYGSKPKPEYATPVDRLAGAYDKRARAS